MSTLHSAQITDRGLLRETNEDALWSSPERPGAAGAAYVVADGLGGLPRGEEASTMAVQTVAEAFEALKAPPPRDWLRTAFINANARILHDNARAGRDATMATTLTAAWFAGGEITAAHVGDSRLYRIRQGNALALTRDHSIGRHTLVRAVGLEKDLKVDWFTHKVEPGDAYLLATDGLYPLLVPGEIAETVFWGTPEEAAKRFVELALLRGGPDNITLILIRVE